MAKKKESKADPTPFQTVTEYEERFVREWKENTASGVAELLKYIAKETASYIKENVK